MADERDAVDARTVEAAVARLARVGEYDRLFDYPGGEVGLWRDARLARHRLAAEAAVQARVVEYLELKATGTMIAPFKPGDTSPMAGNRPLRAVKWRDLLPHQASEAARLAQAGEVG